MKNAGIRTSTLACTNSISGTRRDASRMHVLQFEVCFRSLSSVTKRRAGELATERDPRVAGGDGRPSGDATNRGAAPAGNRRVARETSAVDDFARNDHAGGDTAAAVRAGRRRGDVHRAVAADRLAAPRDRQGVRREQASRGGWIGASPTGSASTAGARRGTMHGRRVAGTVVARRSSSEMRTVKGARRHAAGNVRRSTLADR